MTAGIQDLSNGCWKTKRKLRVTTHFGKNAKYCSVVYSFFEFSCVITSTKVNVNDSFIYALFLYYNHFLFAHKCEHNISPKLIAIPVINNQF